jgi:tetratricopeptide (TPR) repeat protein/predicted Ser/Thr protein kinase
MNGSVLDLVVRWQDLRGEGRELPPETLCADCPELLPQVLFAIHKVRVMDRLLDLPADESDTERRLSKPLDGIPASLPKIDRYEILEVLGRGGVGVVYKARQTGLGRLVALKSLAAGTQADPIALARFRDEAKALALLHHPNFVPVFDVGEQEGLLYFTMEYLEGGSLDKKLADAPQPVREAAALLVILARAIDVAHKQGIVHRDLKPSNVLLMADGTPKISDYGLAKWLNRPVDLTPTDTVLGTPSYMAPEQVRRGAGPRDGKGPMIGPAADIYSLGALLYKMLTGRPPFVGENSVDVILQVLSTDPLSIRRLQPKVPRDLETICLKCLYKEPGRRYATAEDLADDLDRVLEGKPIKARPVGTAERAWRWCRRSPKMAGLLAALLVVLLGGIAGIVVQWRRAEASEAQALEVMGEFLQSAAVIPMQERYFVQMPTPEALRKAEIHCDNLLRIRPDDSRRRIALTKIRGGLATLYLMGEKGAEADACLQNARELWEPLVRQDSNNATYRVWLATTQFWQAYAARSQGHHTRALQLFEQAYVHWQELEEDGPEDPFLLQQALDNPGDLFNFIRETMIPVSATQEILHPLEENRARLDMQVRQAPSSTVHRKSLALTCLLLGELHFQEGSETKARPFWLQAHEHYKILVKEPREDPLVTLSLGHCCFRLMRNLPDDPYYVEAIALHEHAAQRLARLVDQQPQTTRFLKDLLANYRCMLSCHQKAGQTMRVGRIIGDHLRGLMAVARTRGFDPVFAVILLETLTQMAPVLQEARQLGPALEMTREGAALADQCAAFPLRSWTFSNRLADNVLNLATLLRQLKEPAEAVRQAEQARRLYLELRQTAPVDLLSPVGLSEACTQIGKARWDLGHVEEALFAFRESLAAEHQVYKSRRGNRYYQIRLRRCYERLVYRCGLCGKRSEAAAALLEWEKLWPNDARELRDVASNFEELADAVGAIPVLEASTVGYLSPLLGQGPLLAAAGLFPGRTALGQAMRKLTPEERAERQRYIDHSERARQAAKAAADRAGEEARATTQR